MRWADQEPSNQTGFRIGGSQQVLLAHVAWHSSAKMHAEVLCADSMMSCCFGCVACMHISFVQTSSLLLMLAKQPVASCTVMKMVLEMRISNVVSAS